MTRSNRVFAAAAGLALASSAALADPASFPIEDRYDNRDDPGFADVAHGEPIPPLRTGERCEVHERNRFVEPIRVLVDALPADG
jgi:hypothetical protein